MYLLVFLPGLVALAAATENGASDLGIFINPSQMLVMVTSPPIDLDLSGLDLRSLNSLAFKNCASVRTLDLSNNWISELPPGIFSNMTNLEHLSLAYNEFQSKTMIGAFRNLSNLKSLDITHNPLNKILTNNMFVGLPNSCEIYIRGAKNLRTITSSAFGKVKKLGPKNHTPVSESKNCTLHLSEVQEMFDRDKILIRDLIYWDNAVKICTDDTILRFVDFSNVTDTRSPNCHEILISTDWTIVYMEEVRISVFDKGWFRMGNTSVNAIYITESFPYVYVNVTSDLLNDLPENIKIFSITGSNIKGLYKGIMFNEHLRDLSFRGNEIGFIEEDTFAGLKLTRLNLGRNSLVSLDYVSSLPKTLLWLNIDSTWMREIPANTFSQQKNLLVLSLSNTMLRRLQRAALDGLMSLQWLDLSYGRIKYLEPDVFRDLTQLHSLNLTMNLILRFDKGAFSGLGCLAILECTWNRLKSLVGGAFDGLTDSLEVLDVSMNDLELLGAGTFINLPKFNLSLQDNDIRKIEKGTFDLPYLTNLDLRRNNITTIEKGTAKCFGSLANRTEIKLGFNPIERLDNGALAGVSNKARVNLAMTPIKVIQAGVFDDL